MSNLTARMTPCLNHKQSNHMFGKKKIIKISNLNNQTHTLVQNLQKQNPDMQIGINQYMNKGTRLVLNRTNLKHYKEFTNQRGWEQNELVQSLCITPYCIQHQITIAKIILLD